MATLSIPNTFTNGTAAIATEVNANFNAVKTFSEAVAAGTNIDDGAITYSKLAAAAITSLTATDSDQAVLSGQIFG